MYEDGGDEYEFGGQHDTHEDFSEKQYESDDSNDDEDGYKGDYNVKGLDHPDLPRPPCRPPCRSNNRMGDT